jgi:large subunit ribosomal protein L28
MSSKNTLVMRARVCDLTGKKPNRQARVITFSNQRNKTVQHVNLQWKRFFSEELDRKVRLRVSTKAIKTVTKLGGIDKAAKKYEIDLAKF